MGYSLSTGKTETLQWIQSNQFKINSIIDIGAGSGTYINLVKGANVCVNTNWVAVEAWEEYINKFDLRSKYNTVIHQDVRTLDWDKLGNFDLAIAGDVLEHMTKPEAIALVDKILAHCKTLIISIPIVHMPQDELEGNPFEVHVKDDWSHNEVIATWGAYIKETYRKSGKSKIGVYWLTK